MERRFLAMLGGVVGISAVLVAVVLLTRPGTTNATGNGTKDTGDKKNLTVKVILPQEDAKVVIDGNLIRGNGTERTHKIATTKDVIEISTSWEPNNYTKITRKKKLDVKGKAEVVIDLSKPTDVKDDIVVRWVPTPQDVVEKMCEVAKVSKEDVVYDLGCGDAVMLITALKKFGAKRGVGVDIDQKMVRIARKKVKEAGLTDKVDIRKGDVLKVDDLSDADVVLLYMGDDINNRLKPILKKTLKPGARVVSHRFLMGDWKPQSTVTVKSSEGYDCDVHLWVVKEEDRKKVALKALLPQADAVLIVDGREIKSEGSERTVTVAVSDDQDKIVVQTRWEPNNYTKITRTKNAAIKEGEIVVDLRKETDVKDDIVVRWVPTPQDVVEKMCEVAKVGKNDVVYDLGCGDAVMLITAVKKFGAKRGVGVELDEKMVKVAKEKAKEEGVADKIEIRQGDVLKVKDLSDANVVLLYMGDDINNRLKPILKETLKTGSRVVSHRFLMGEWKPDHTETVNSSAGYPCDVHLWIIRSTKKGQ